MIEQPFKKVWRKGEALLGGIDGLLHGPRAHSETSGPTRVRLPDASAESTLSIRDFMTHDPISIRVDTPLHEALGLLIENDLSALPVVDEQGRIVGLLNERHVLRAFGDPENTTITSAMDTEPITVDIDLPIVEIVDRLMVINVRQVLVLEGSRLVGVVTRADLMPAVLETLRTRIFGNIPAVH